MRKIAANDPATRSTDIVAENIEHLKASFPEALTEGKIDFNVLKQLLGAEVDEHGETYGLNWHGKRPARQVALTPSTGTLRPCPEESVAWATTRNLMIEGDNLEVLKLLQKSYAGKVKLIYIDPPYNTGKDFIYRDNYRDNIRNYLELTGQIDRANRKLASNTEASGRFHTDWLNMMLPRLKLARHLLRDDGVIFISIDDSEQANLRKLCDEVFGEENFISSVIWSRKRGKDNSAKFLSRNHEYLFAYSKNIRDASFARLEMPENTRRAYKNPDNDPRGDYRLLGLWSRGSQGGSKYSFTSKSGRHFDEGLWLVGHTKMKKLDNDNSLVFKNDKVYRKLYLTEYKPGLFMEQVDKGFRTDIFVPSHPRFS